MRWIAKAAVQRLLSTSPGGARLNYLFQRRVTRQLPRSEQHFRLHGTETLRHFDAFRRHAPTSERTARFYEFGAGWDLITPIVYCGLGVEHQTIVDIRPHLRFEQVNHTIAQYGRHQDALGREAMRPLRRLDERPIGSCGELERRTGIAYLAPCDARRTGLPGESFDFISSTFTLEHIPVEDIPPILAECWRLLRPGGIISSSIDLQDHYSFIDPTISAFNFLKFSDRTWAMVNSSLHHQNRLRERDQRQLHERAGFDIVETSFEKPSADDLETVGALRLAPRFRHAYNEEELAIREVRIVGRKPTSREPESRAGRPRTRTRA